MKLKGHRNKLANMNVKGIATSHANIRVRAKGRSNRHSKRHVDFQMKQGSDWDIEGHAGEERETTPYSTPLSQVPATGSDDRNG